MRLDCVLLRLLGALVIEPTSLKRGEGLLSGGCRFYGDGGVERQHRGMRGGIGENEHDESRVRFPDALAGPPTCWVSPDILPFIALRRA